MISVSEATAIINQHPLSSHPELVDIAKAEGCILAEEVTADRDFPPFDRASMDGIAIAFEQFSKGRREFVIERVLAAGEPAVALKDPGAAIEIMTGAVVPPNTDTVIRYEDISIQEGKAKVLVNAIERNQNIHRQGADAQANAVLLKPGLRISPAEIALLASVGKNRVQVQSMPHVAIISTGNELVGISATPLPHQVRQSNNYALQAALNTLGCASSLYHLPDDKTILEKRLKKIFSDHDVVILSGGVSKGKYDFIPDILESLHVQKLFHQVSQKPGKPFWFGTSAKNIVFALPGNPVSTFMCYYRYIQPWLLKSIGGITKSQYAVLSSNFSFTQPLTYFLQVAVHNEAGRLLATPRAGGGSGDFANLKDVDGFLELPADKSEFKAGDVFSFFPFRG